MFSTVCIFSFLGIVEISFNDIFFHSSVNPSNLNFYFKSGSSGGLTSSDVAILQLLNIQGFINKDISIKVAFPFAPSITIAFLISITFGDIIMGFSKIFSLVI